MSIYDELKRRNVVKAAVLYVVASWLILQVADVLFDAMELPAVWVRLVLAILILGFPLAIVLSWVYEMTPDGLKREKDVDRERFAKSETGRKTDILIIVMLALAIGAVTLEQLADHVSTPVLIGIVILLIVTATILTRIVPRAISNSGEDEGNDAPKTPHVSSITDSLRAIAVLPFVNMSSDDEQDYFSDGLSEELLNLLTRIPELRVAARTSSFSYKNKEVKVAQIGEELNVDHVLEGSVRKSGNRLRITAQLIQAENGYHLWSETFDRTLDDVFVIQDEIAAKVVAQLKITLLGAVPVVNETDPEAYSVFLLARHLGRQGSVQTFERSIELYEKALAIDPSYVAAMDGVASVYCDQADRGKRPIEEGYSLAREAARNTLVIEPEYAKGHARLGWIANRYDGDLVAAARHLDRALELDATDLDILEDAAALTASLGRMEEAIALQVYVLNRDPLNVRCHRSLGYSYIFAGRPDDAIASFRTALALSPGIIGVHQLTGVALLLKKEPDAALAAIQQDEDSWRDIGLVMAYHALGRESESNAALAKAIEVSEQTAAYNIAFTLAFRGEADRAFEWLDKAVQYRDPGLSYVANMPLFANIHNDSRWPPFLENLGRSPKQLASIKFEFRLPD